MNDDHLHSIGATRTGKARLMQHIVTELVRDLNTAIILIDPKGYFGQGIRDFLKGGSDEIQQNGSLSSGDDSAV